MKKEHTTKQQRHALQTKRAARNKRKGKGTVWQSLSMVAGEAAARLMYRFADKHGLKVGTPSKAAIRRELHSLSVEELQSLHGKLGGAELKEI